MPTATEAPLTTAIRNIELVAVGTWDASTGRTRITEKDLQAMVTASQDPSYDAAPVKIGHDDDRFQDANGQPPSTRDGEPAYGWVENLRLSEDGKKLIGDFVGVPSKLAEIMHTALRRRSVELIRHDRVGGKVYPAVLTGVALLGVQAPAVKGLKDLRDLFADQLTPKPERFSVTVADDDTPTIPPSQPAETHGGGEATTATKDGVAMALKLSPAQRHALGLSDDASDDEIRAALQKLGLKLADGSDDTQQQVTPETNPAAPTTLTPDAPAAPAPVATQTPAAPAAPVQAAPVQTTNPTAPAQTQQTQPTAAPNPPAQLTPQMVAASASSVGLAVIDPVMLAELQRNAAAGAAAKALQDKQRRDGLVMAAQREGKFHPAAYNSFREMADQDEDGVVKLFAAMPAVLPVQPVGHAEQFSGNPTAPAAAGNSPEKLSEQRAPLYDFFGVPAPVAAKG